MAHIINDLIRLREATGWSQRQFAKKAGLNYGKVQQIEAHKRRIWIDDLSRWLDTCGSSLPLYLSQHLAVEEVKTLKRDKEIAAAILKTLQIPHRRKVIDGLLEGWSADDARFDETPE